MARLFIRHSSRNNDRAIAVRDWLIANGWDDLFPDLERAIAAGQRWKKALQKIYHRPQDITYVMPHRQESQSRR